jgi:hypothetical protein
MNISILHLSTRKRLINYRIFIQHLWSWFNLHHVGLGVIIWTIFFYHLKYDVFLNYYWIHKKFNDNFKSHANLRILKIRGITHGPRGLDQAC